MPRLPLRLAFAAAAAALALGGCGDRQSEALSVVVIGDKQPSVADPADGPLTPAQQVLMQAVAQGLVRFDPRGRIEPGLAERWNVSDDGLSYIFRLSAGQWPDGRAIRARDVARMLTRQLRKASRNPARDSLGAVEEVVAMTDRVIEIRLSAPRPNLLQLLAQPELALTRETLGAGPFVVDQRAAQDGAIALVHVERIVDGPDRRDRIDLGTAPAPSAIAAFAAGRADLVLGGSFVDLPLARGKKIAKSALRFDPVAGLFGLVPARRGGPLAKPELRALLNQAIDRQSLIAALGVPGLAPRATVLQGGLEGLAAPAQPAWLASPMPERRARLAAEARVVFGDGDPPTLTIALPDGPGAQILFDRLAADWRPLGVRLERVTGKAVADLKLVDAVAPSASPAWFVRAFRCGVIPICLADADILMDSARAATVAAQRAAFIAEAARLIDERNLFLPLAAPVRWSLVGKRVGGFAENEVARHPLIRLSEPLGREGR